MVWAYTAKSAQRAVSRLPWRRAYLRLSLPAFGGQNSNAARLNTSCGASPIGVIIGRYSGWKAARRGVKARLMTHRIDQTFAARKAAGQAAFVAYMMAGDPDRAVSQAFLNALPEAGVDIIELGVPFTDPMADGPVIEEAGIRARKSGTTLTTVLEMATAFRKTNDATPIILMGYANPLHHMGYTKFAAAAKTAGVDGAIIVDLPPEEDNELREAFAKHDLALIRLATPTTDTQRLPKVVAGTKGFVYYVSMTGITGASFAQAGSVTEQVARVREAADLPVVVGFGVKTPERAREVAKDADGVVVGTAIVKTLHENGPDAALNLIRMLADATHSG